MRKILIDEGGIPVYAKVEFVFPRLLWRCFRLLLETKSVKVVIGDLVEKSIRTCGSNAMVETCLLTHVHIRTLCTDANLMKNAIY